MHCTNLNVQTIPLHINFRNCDNLRLQRARKIELLLPSLAYHLIWRVRLLETWTLLQQLHTNLYNTSLSVYVCMRHSSLSHVNCILQTELQNRTLSFKWNKVFVNVTTRKQYLNVVEQGCEFGWDFELHEVSKCHSHVMQLRYQSIVRVRRICSTNVRTLHQKYNLRTIILFHQKNHNVS